MANPIPSVPQPPDALSLQRDYPFWRIWQSNRGRWWATLNAQLSDGEIKAGCARTVDGDDLGDLRQAIEDQEARRCKVAEDQP